MNDPVQESFRRLQLEATLRNDASDDERLAAIVERLDESDGRWDDAAFREKVGHVLEGALQEAGRVPEQKLAVAMAPHVVGTIRQEFMNSQDALVEALHPKVGVLIREAMANAIADLQRQVDEALPIDLWIAQIKSRLFGANPLGQILARDTGFLVHEAYLIERGSGMLLAREIAAAPDADAVPFDDDLIAGMIAALDSFAEEAFAAQEFGSLRRIELQLGTVYLRATPRKILALCCSGTAPPEIERRIDILLERTIEQAQGDEGALDALPLLNAGTPAEKAGMSGSALVGRVGGGIAAVVALFWMHGALENANQERWTQNGLAAAVALPSMQGYPIAASFVEDRRVIRLEGLVPDDETRVAVVEAVRRVSGPLKVETVLPTAGERFAR